MHEFILIAAVSANDSTQDEKAPEAAVNSSEVKVKNSNAGTADHFSPVYLVTLTNISLCWSAFMKYSNCSWKVEDFCHFKSIVFKVFTCFVSLRVFVKRMTYCVRDRCYSLYTARIQKCNGFTSPDLVSYSICHNNAVSIWSIDRSKIYSRTCCILVALPECCAFGRHFNSLHYRHTAILSQLFLKVFTCFFSLRVFVKRFIVKRKTSRTSKYM